MPHSFHSSACLLLSVQCHMFLAPHSHTLLHGHKSGGTALDDATSKPASSKPASTSSKPTPTTTTSKPAATRQPSIEPSGAGPAAASAQVEPRTDVEAELRPVLAWRGHVVAEAVARPLGVGDTHPSERVAARRGEPRSEAATRVGPNGVPARAGRVDRAARPSSRVTVTVAPRVKERVVEVGQHAAAGAAWRGTAERVQRVAAAKRVQVAVSNARDGHTAQAGGRGGGVQRVDKGVGTRRVGRLAAGRPRVRGFTCAATGRGGRRDGPGKRSAAFSLHFFFFFFWAATQPHSAICDRSFVASYPIQSAAAENHVCRIAYRTLWDLATKPQFLGTYGAR